MKIKKAVLKVKDIEKMKNYYTNVLGMQIITINDEKVNLGTENNIILTLITDKETKLKDRKEANLYHIAYLLPNKIELANFLKHVINLNVEI